jgi:hypothetical protein
VEAEGGFDRDRHRRRKEKGGAGVNMRLIRVENCSLIIQSRHNFAIGYIYIYLFYKYKFLFDLAIFNLYLTFVLVPGKISMASVGCVVVVVAGRGETAD